MIRDITKQEFRRMLRDRRLHIALAILSILFVLSIIGTYDYYASINRQHEEAGQATREQWENQSDKNPHSAAHYGTFVFKPVYPLSYFDQGVDAFTGNTLFLEAHRSNQSKDMAALDQSEFARLGVMTPAFVLGILMPLFIILFGYGTASEERESGRLRLLMAQGAGNLSLFWGKSFALWLLVLLFALPFFLVGGGVLLFTGSESVFWWRYGLIVLLYLVYFGCFIHLTLLISALAGKQNVALVSSLSAWVLICLIVPKVAVNIAKQVHPAPSWHAYQTAIEEDLENGVDGHDPYDDFTRKLEEETLLKYNVDSVHKLPFNWSGFAMQKGEEHETYVFQKHKNELLGIYQKQQAIYVRAAWLSPYVLTTVLSQRLAGTDVEVYYDFLVAAEDYRVQLVGELNEDLTRNFEYGDWSGKRGQEFFSQNSRFEYKPPELQDLLRSMVKPGSVTICWFLLSGLLAGIIFSRIKPV